ncbi:C2 domain [Phytophthora cinnamomi]|uniref:C2 domain n=1 Tax=Phytophthora cinnamomi TaxID=4785 RepID=UPI0035598466|nr:C2 domain [Phytophthora cinnamomi]
MLGSRVKSIWQTRIGRSRSRENASAPEEPDANNPAEPEQDYRESVIESKVVPATPHTPALDADFYKYSMDDSVYVSKTMALDDVIPVSPSSSSTTLGSTTESPSSTAEKLPEKTSANPVTSMFRTFSDSRMFPSIMNKPPPAPAPVPESVSPSPSSSSSSTEAPTATTSAASSTRFSFAPPIPTPWRTSRSASDCTASSSSSSSSSTFSFAMTSSLPPREAAENALNNVHSVCSRCRTAVSSSITRGSPYGELVVVDILEARGLAADRGEGGSDLPFTVSLQLDRMSRKSKLASRENLQVNERFLFWLVSSPTIGQRTVDVFVLGNDGRDLGEVHLSLSMPVNETFADWYPLVSRADGLKHGSVKVSMRRLVLTSAAMVVAAQSLGERKTCLDFSDSSCFGELLPDLWSCFPGSEPEVAASSPPKESSKLGRLIGIQEHVQRDVF